MPLYPVACLFDRPGKQGIQQGTGRSDEDPHPAHFRMDRKDHHDGADAGQNSHQWQGKLPAVRVLCRLDIVGHPGKQIPAMVFCDLFHGKLLNLMKQPAADMGSRPCHRALKKPGKQRNGQYKNQQPDPHGEKFPMEQAHIPG